MKKENIGSSVLAPQISQEMAEQWSSGLSKAEG
jgi:hypothetical protein